MFDGNKWFIKGSLTLVPDKGKAVAWSTHARKSESYPGVIYFSLILSDAHISVEKGISGNPIHLEVHNYYEHRYLYQAMYVESRKPRFYLEREKERWWERLWGKIVLHTEVAVFYNYTTPSVKTNKTYPVEFPTYLVLESKNGKNPLWSVVEELIERESEAEDLGIREGEIESFIEQIFLSDNEVKEVHVPERIFLISPKAMIYRNKEGKALVREGNYGVWAVVNTGTLDGSIFSVYDSLKERGHRVKSRIYRIETKGGVLFGAMRRVSDWTRVWNLALVPHEVKLDSDETIQNLVLVMEGEKTLPEVSPEALVP